MAKFEKFIIACLTGILILSTSYSHDFVFAQTKGPRTEDLIIKFHPNIKDAYRALKNGSIDMLGDFLTGDLLQDAQGDPNLVLGPLGSWDMYEFDINNNYTASPLESGRRSPTSYLNFRRGLAYCIDKDLIVDTYSRRFAFRIDQPLGYGHRGWRNQSYWYEDGTYPYEFNPVLAAAAFDAAGFVEGTDANPEPDLGQPGYTPFLRIHPDTGVTMNPLEVCSRTDDVRRHEAGKALVAQLSILGIPVNHVEAEAAVLYPKVMDNFEYHVYTGGWSGVKYPVTALGMYHSSQYMLGGSNYVTGNDSLGNPNYPLLDSYIERNLGDHEEAVSVTKLALGYIIEECITISLFSPKYFYAWSANLLGVVQPYMDDYTLLNAYKVDGSPIRVGLKKPPVAMNKIYSEYPDIFRCLDRMDLYSSLNNPPFDDSVYQAGYILSWSTGTWIDPDNSWERTVVTQTYRDDAWFVEPATGNQLEHVNATHHYASIWYDYQLSDAPNNNYVDSVKTLRITDPYAIEIYYDWLSYWSTYSLDRTSIRSFNWFSKGSLSQTVTETLTANATAGYLSCTEPVFYVLNAESDGTPLTVGVDYDIYKDPDGPHNADVRVINPAYFGASINITYLATNDASGYTPGDLPWQDAFEGAGMYYATDFTPGSGGYLMLKRNPFYPTETPLLGEVDFIRKSNGCYKIDIFDVLRGVNAYGSQGISVPDANWFPGADLAYPGGQIDIFDIITIAAKYGFEWDCP